MFLQAQSASQRPPKSTGKENVAAQQTIGSTGKRKDKKKDAKKGKWK